jgi:hypothetical protein
VVVEEQEEEEEEDTSPNLEPEPVEKQVNPPNSPPDLEEESSIIALSPTPAPRKRGRPSKKNSKHRRLDKRAKVVLERVISTSFFELFFLLTNLI